MSKYKNILTKAFLYQEYIIKENSTYLIAEKVGCGQVTVLRYLKKYNIRTRTYSEALFGKYLGEYASNYKDGQYSNIYYCAEKGCNNIICYETLKYGQGRCHHHARIYKWKNQAYRENQIRRMFRGMDLSPNNPEKILIKLLNKLLPKQYTFVGDGKLIVGGYVPDFVNKDNNKIIEHYGTYWHNKADMKNKDKKRIKAYNKEGYKTLIIWQYELKDLDRVEKKILKFNKK